MTEINSDLFTEHDCRKAKYIATGLSNLHQINLLATDLPVASSKLVSYTGTALSLIHI